MQSLLNTLSYVAIFSYFAAYCTYLITFFSKELQKEEELFQLFVEMTIVWFSVIIVGAIYEIVFFNNHIIVVIATIASIAFIKVFNNLFFIKS